MNTARQFRTTEHAVLCFGTMQHAPRKPCLVRTETGLYPALRAAGCLLAPEDGDSVLVAIDGASRAYVLCVLERASDAPARVGIATGFTLDAEAGPLGLSGERVDIAAASLLSMTAATASLVAPDTRIDATRLSLFGETLSTVLGALEAKVGRVVERFRRVHRRVEESETAEIGRLRVTVKGNMHVQARDALLKTEEDLALDGKHIHLG